MDECLANVLMLFDGSENACRQAAYDHSRIQTADVRAPRGVQAHRYHAMRCVILRGIVMGIPHPLVTYAQALLRLSSVAHSLTRVSA